VRFATKGKLAKEMLKGAFWCSAPTAPSTSTPLARLLDEEWELVKPLMPPQKPPTGRPRSDHRTVLAGMVWVFGSGASWRDLPEEEFGPWRTVYGR
jgi:hypothetical protein